MIDGTEIYPQYEEDPAFDIKITPEIEAGVEKARDAQAAYIKSLAELKRLQGAAMRTAGWPEQAIRAIDETLDGILDIIESIA